MLAILAAVLIAAGGAVAWRVRQVDQIRAQLAREGIYAMPVARGSRFDEVPILGQGLYVLRGKTMVARNSAAVPPMTDVDWSRALPLLKQLPPVMVISLHGTDLSGRSLRTFGEFPALESVSLSRSQIGDADVSALGSVSGLRHLHLEQTAVTGTGLSALTGIQTLTSLTLDGSPVSEEGIDAISQISQLTSISMSNVGLAESEIRRLEHALPGVMLSDD
jgi:hypothetical protein